MQLLLFNATIKSHLYWELVCSLKNKKLSVFQFVIAGVYGSTNKTDIAIDSVCITTCDGKLYYLLHKQERRNMLFSTFVISCFF